MRLETVAILCFEQLRWDSNNGILRLENWRSTAGKRQRPARRRWTDTRPEAICFFARSFLSLSFPSAHPKRGTSLAGREPFGSCTRVQMWCRREGRFSLLESEPRPPSRYSSLGAQTGKLARTRRRVLKRRRSFAILCFPGARYPSGKGEVCKTFIRGFDSHPRLHHIVMKISQLILSLFSCTSGIPFVSLSATGSRSHALRTSASSCSWRQRTQGA